MSTVIPQNDLTSEDLAVLSPDSTANQELFVEEFEPGDAFGFGPVCISQIVRPVEPSD